MALSNHLKKFSAFSLILALLISFTLFVPFQVMADTALDSDIVPTAGNSYTISTAEQLITLSNIVASGNTCSGATFRLTANIDLNAGLFFNSDGSYTGNPVEFTPIGNNDNPFSGTFDGAGYTIRGIYIDDTNESASTGMFGYIKKATISNLAIANSYISGKGIVGGICGKADTSSVLINSTNRAYVHGSGKITGGVCGLLTGNSTITSCANSAAVVSTKTSSGGDFGVGVGGVCGVLDSESGNILISKSYNLAAVTASDCANVGGVVGSTASKVDSCYNAGAITGSSYVGGICGAIPSGDISNAYNLGAITGKTYIGGIAGYSSGYIYFVYNIGVITANSDHGGITSSCFGVNSAYTTQNTPGGTGASCVFTDLATKAALPAGFDGEFWEQKATDAEYCYPSLKDVTNPDLSANSDGSLIHEIVLEVTTTNKNDSTLPPSEDKDVTATYKPGQVASTVYSINIVWGSLAFQYTEGSAGTWNPETHTYDGVTEGVWSCENGADVIKVTNHSNAPLRADFSYTPAAGYNNITGTFSNSNFVLNSAENTTPQNAPTNSTVLTLSGNLSENISGDITIGKITVSFAVE